MKLLKLFTAWMRWCPVPLPGVAAICLILWLTLAPDPMGEVDMPLFEGIDKVVHACMFGFLGSVWWFDVGRRGGNWRSPRAGVSLLCAGGALAMGIVIELLQGAMQLGRSFEWADMVADGAGCAIAFLCMCLLRC